MALFCLQEACCLASAEVNLHISDFDLSKCFMQSMIMFSLEFYSDRQKTLWCILTQSAQNQIRLH